MLSMYNVFHHWDVLVVTDESFFERGYNPMARAVPVAKLEMVRDA